MARKRLIIFFGIIFFISLLTFVVIKIAQGYRPDLTTKTLRPTGLLVATSIPDGAQLWINGKLRSATNNTLSLSPDEYLVEIKKDGFTSWKKNLLIEKGLVVKTEAYLFSTYPDLKALTFTGAANPLLSPDGQKVVFGVSGASIGKDGLWVLDLADRPLGLSREPRQIIASAPGGRDFAQAEYQWSPDSKQILITLENRPGKLREVVTENFLLEADRFNLAVELIEIGENLPQIKKGWDQEEKIRQEVQLSKLPKELLEKIGQAIDEVEFAPDETKLLYTATASATIPEEIVPPLPATNTQPERRDLKPGEIYVYDLKEDKNFFITEKDESKKLGWFGPSRHLFWVEKGKVKIGEYDNTNWVDVYTGPFEDFSAFPFPAANKILILASIGENAPLNLYAVILR